MYYLKLSVSTRYLLTFDTRRLVAIRYNLDSSTRIVCKPIVIDGKLSAP